MNFKATATLLLTASLLAGCKAKSTQNPDGTVTNPNGSVTVPAQQAPASAAPPQQLAIRNQDGSITNPDGSVTYPSGSKVAQKENNPNPASQPETRPVVQANSSPVVRESAPVVRESAPIIREAAPVSRTAPAGTAVRVRINGGLSAHRNEVGDRFTGSLASPIVYEGSTIAASGTEVSGEVVAAKGKGRFKGAGDLGIELTSIGRSRVSTTEYEKVGKGRGKRSAAFTGGGAGLGALIGGLAGGGKGALIGGLAGAGGGAAAGSYTGSTDVIIPAESVVTFRLTSSLTR